MANTTLKIQTGLETGTGAFSGTVTYGTYIATPAEFSAGNSGSAKTLNWSNGSAQKVTMTADCTFTLQNPVVGAVYVLKLVQDATGSRNFTWPANVRWSADAGPMGSGATKIDIVNFYYDGTNYYASAALNFSP